MLSKREWFDLGKVRVRSIHAVGLDLQYHLDVVATDSGDGFPRRPPPHPRRGEPDATEAPRVLCAPGLRATPRCS